jgi:hypothetical protein
MKRFVLVGGLALAAAVVALLLLRPTVSPIADPPAASPVVAAGAPAATVAPVAHAVAAPPAPTAVPSASAPASPSGVVAPPSGPAPPVAAPAAAPAAMTRQEKIDRLVPGVPALAEQVTRLRKEADEEERQGHLDAAKEKRVAADRHERRLGEIRAALDDGKLPPGFVNPTSTDHAKQ